MVNEAAIQETIIDLKSQKVTNYANTAKRFKIILKTLEHCFKIKMFSQLNSIFRFNNYSPMPKKKYWWNRFENF